MYARTHAKNTPLSISSPHRFLLSGRLPFFLILFLHLISSFFPPWRVYWGNSSNLHFFSTCLSVLLAWRPMSMRRVINEFVRVSFTRPLQPTHEASIVDETDDFFLLLRSYRSGSTIFFFYRPPQSPLLAIEPSTNTRSLRSLTATILPIVWTSFLHKTENSAVCEGFCDLLSSEAMFISWETWENE